MPTTAAPEQTLQGLLMAAAHVQQTAENLPDPARTSALSVADRAARVARAVATVDAPIGLAALDDAVEVVREAWRLAATYATHADDPVAPRGRPSAVPAGPAAADGADRRRRGPPARALRRR